ncbi:MAG: SIMPL domain-containing protein [Proteobacteria bacterium]|nr:SIMPL domain-containing protein [Pseudomonadota bacterium]
MSFPRRSFSFVIVACALAAPLVAPGAAHAIERLITVSGDATVAVAPDLAMIRLGVTSQAKTAREASDANAKQMTSVLAAIKEAGIADRDVRTSRLSLQPQYDQSKPGAARLLGFQVTNQVTVRIREIDKLPSILDHAIAAGANEMSGIEFIVSEQSKLLDQARDDAIADARRKAELYAKAAGVKLGSVTSIVEEGSSPPPRPVMQALRAGAVPVAPGEQMLRAAVTVSFELTP